MSQTEKEVTPLELPEYPQSEWARETKRWIGVIIGALTYSIGFNIFLVPVGLYASGFMGFSQLTELFLTKGLNLDFGSLKLPGIIYYIYNLPLLYTAVKTMRRRFFIKTIFTVTCITVFLTLIPVAKEPILEETIANTLVAGLMCGAGIGISLRMGASDGGTELLGMIIIQHKGNSSVGQINLIFNTVLYSICLLIYNVPIVIYSLVFTAVLSFVIDKVHIQNINVRVLIVTQMENPRSLELEIMGQIGRGITRWKGNGAYTGKEETILMVVVNKYEVRKIRALVRDTDPRAFVLFDEGVGVSGNFLRKLT
ncbi:MAG: YitT family protein [Thermoguttaceae bacterium]|jgi:uncharacterized membrane-anchored protein YitT (DUF2179 family)